MQCTITTLAFAADAPPATCNTGLPPFICLTYRPARIRDVIQATESS